MTVEAGDAPFDPDGAPAAPGAPATGSVRPAAPAWLTGEAALPWPPPGAAASQRGPAVPAPRAPEVPPPVRPVIVPGVPPRPRIVEEPGILGLSRLTRGRFGSRLFTLFFVLVFTLIAVQMVVSILYPW